MILTSNENIKKKFTLHQHRVFVVREKQIFYLAYYDSVIRLIIISEEVWKRELEACLQKISFAQYSEEDLRCRMKIAGYNCVPMICELPES